MRACVQAAAKLLVEVTFCLDVFAGARRDVIRTLIKAGLDRSEVDYATTVEAARTKFQRLQALQDSAPTA